MAATAATVRSARHPRVSPQSLRSSLIVGGQHTFPKQSTLAAAAMAAGLPSAIPEDDRLDEVSMPWSPTRDPSARELPRLLSQGSLRLRSSLQSQKSLSNMEGASLLRTSSMKVNVMLGGDKEPSETLSRRSAIRDRLEDLDANHDGEPLSRNLPSLACSYTRRRH